PGHVGDAVVHDAVDDVGRGVVGGGADRLDAAALVDGDVDDDAPLLHHAQHVAGHQPRRAGSGDEHRPDEQVGAREHLEDVAQVARHRLQGAAEDVVDVLEPRVVDVEQGDPGADAERDLGRVDAHGAAAEDHDLAGADAGYAPQQHAAAAVRPFEEVSPHLRRHAAGDLAHGREQRQAAAVELHRLVGDGGGAGSQERIGQGFVGGEVQVGEEDEVIAQVAVLGGDRLLD